MLLEAGAEGEPSLECFGPSASARRPAEPSSSEGPLES